KRLRESERQARAFVSTLFILKPFDQRLDDLFCSQTIRRSEQGCIIESDALLKDSFFVAKSQKSEIPVRLSESAVTYSAKGEVVMKEVQYAIVDDGISRAGLFQDLCCFPAGIKNVKS